MLVGNDDVDVLEQHCQFKEFKFRLCPRNIAEEPVMWVGTNLAYPFAGLGIDASSVGSLGVKALGMNSAYVGRHTNAPNMNLDASGVTSSL